MSEERNIKTSEHTIHVGLWQRYRSQWRLKVYLAADNTEILSHVPRFSASTNEPFRASHSFLYPQQYTLSSAAVFSTQNFTRLHLSQLWFSESTTVYCLTTNSFQHPQLYTISAVGFKPFDRLQFSEPTILHPFTRHGFQYAQLYTSISQFSTFKVV
jgi:hypothetical protein